MQGLQARLASPETFRRIGLEPPQGIVADLEFTPAVDDNGDPIRFGPFEVTLQCTFLSASVSGMPCDIFATFSAGCRSSASTKGR